MTAKNDRFWAKVLFREFIKHYRKLNAEQKVADIDSSMDALEDLDDTGDSFGAKMVRWSMERENEPSAVASRENGKKGGRPKKNQATTEDSVSGDATDDSKAPQSSNISQDAPNGNAGEDERSWRAITRNDSSVSENLDRPAPNMRRVPQNEAPAHGFSGGRAAQGTMSRSPEAAAQSGKVYDQKAAPTSTNEARQSKVREDRRMVGIPAVRGNAKVSTSTMRSFGANGNVRLTIESGKKLRELYGEDLDLAISFLDGYIQDLPSKELGQPKGGSKFWKEEYLAKDHASVLRYGNWVWKKVQEAKTTEARRTNAENGGRAFKSQAEKNEEAIANIERYYDNLIADSHEEGDNIVRIAK